MSDNPAPDAKITDAMVEAARMAAQLRADADWLVMRSVDPDNEVAARMREAAGLLSRVPVKPTIMWSGKYRKKPIVIEAVPFVAGHQPYELANDVIAGRVRYVEDGTALISTLEGEMIARSGDWIIRGVKGELYPCKPDIFAAIYEPITQEDNGLVRALKALSDAADQINGEIGKMNDAICKAQTLLSAKRGAHGTD